MKHSFVPTPLVDLAEVAAGQAAPQGREKFNCSGMPFIRAGSLEGLLSGGSEDDCEHITAEVAEEHGLRLFPRDTILFAKSGMSAKIGRVYRLTKPAFVVSHLAALVPGKNVCPSYLQRWLEANPPSRLIPNDAYPSIRLSAIETLEIPIPFPNDPRRSLAEQKRIAAILGKADAIRQRRKSVEGLYEHLVPSFFHEMFGRTIAEISQWPISPLGKFIVDGPQNGLYRPASEYGSGTRIVRIDSFYKGELRDLDSLKRLRIDDATLQKWALRPGDILVNRVNSTAFLGKSAIVPELEEPVVFESNMMRFTVDNRRLLPPYLIAALQTQFVRRQILQKERPAVNQSSINQGDVQSLEVPVAPIEMQKEFVTRLPRIQGARDACRSRIDAVEGLFGSLVQRAFRGEL